VLYFLADIYMYINFFFYDICFCCVAISHPMLIIICLKIEILPLYFHIYNVLLIFI
ncbi:hypothetical protein L9F63_006971, partial [Diploptera punctata]